MINKFNDEIKYKYKSDEVKYKPYLRRSNKYLAKTLSHRLLNNIYECYNHSIEPILVIGIASIARFKDDLFEMCKGFPVAYLYGPTNAGKTNMLNNIVYLYGFDENFINSGDSTVISMWQNLDNYNSIPVIYDELSRITLNDSKIEGLIKSAYQGINRDKISQTRSTVNATLILSSNYQPPQKPEILNRLLLCKFEQQNFKIYDSAVVMNNIIKFNDIRNKYLSNLLPDVLKYSPDKVIKMFKQNRKTIKILNSNINNRSIDNIAIAYTGYQVLLAIAKEDEPNEVKEKFERFVKDYTEVLNIESPWDEFINALPLLARNKSIINNTDYKYAYDKEESKENNQIIHNLSPHCLCIHFEHAYIAFVKHYKQFNKNIPPTKKELESYAKNDENVIRGQRQLTKGVYINGIKKRCLIIDISGNYELSNLDKM